MITAIVYTSNTGYTEKYARMLSAQTSIPAYSSDAARNAVSAGSEVIHFGWLMGGMVRGYASARKRYRVSAVCGVGLSASDKQIATMRDRNSIPAETVVFNLQGGFDMNRLRGVYKWMMRAVRKPLMMGLESKERRSADDEAALQMLLYGGDYVAAENLAPIVAWIDAQR